MADISHTSTAGRRYSADAWIERARSWAEANTTPNSESGREQTLRIFIAGDQSQVGKSSTCLGLLAGFLQSGYAPSELAYIKPVTQCEQPQLVTTFCKFNGIACRGIGPLVFYSGFTRAFLNGETNTTEELLEAIQESVDTISKGKRVVIIDGVGYPAVGSICGCSNAVVAKRINAPCLLIGRKGVGDAVDSFNLNASYFGAHEVPVLGAIYNRLPREGYYSLDKCKAAVSRYFEQFRPDQSVYGFVPEVEFPDTLDNSSCKGGSHCDMKKINIFINVFLENVDIAKLLREMKNIHAKKNLTAAAARQVVSTSVTVDAGRPKRSRGEIQGGANSLGASGG